ncbi:hypothetical protein [Acrocarpospora pleiomorpha]|uniref:hypothetical protein n=1 Tax=Acrocarpospora pleiomorpha TaxID=90975 RepID=UPI0012D32438|nr:hypothetical protein [Acrocarpospora pleiomorpha]
MTVRAERQVLAVVRNLASAGRLADVLPVFGSDPRIQTLFTTVSGSAFDDGLGEYLRKIRARVVPWRQAVGTEFDLTVAASPNGELNELRAPLLLMSHGAGHNRLLRTPNGYSSQVAGLARSQLVRDGRVLPAAIALSHREQLERLARYCPEAVPFAVVTGDPSFDRMVAHLPRRERYRRALGVPPGGTLVVVSSTWGEHSLFGAASGLLARLVSELPMDEYRVAVLTHPNIRAWHGGLQVDLWLSAARAAGLTVIPPEQGWQAALIAADVVIGDHGSVTLYGVALDRPTMLASSGGEGEELDPESPIAELVGRLPRLDLDRRLLEQIRGVIATYVPGAYADVTGRTLGQVGDSGEAFRRVVYRLIDLPVPPGPVVPSPLPEPYGERLTPSAFLARVRFTPGGVDIKRYPAAARLDDAGPDPYLVVDIEELDRRLVESAAIIVGRGQRPGWAEDTLRRYPGCAATALADDHQVLMTIRDGPELLLSATPDLDPAILPCVVHAWLAMGHRLDDLFALTISVGFAKYRINATPPRSI